MDDEDFFDLIYQQWSKTTGASDTYWMPEDDTEHYAAGPGTWNVWSVNDKQEKAFVANFEHEVDADFITAIHGCLGDLVRRLRMAVDAAERSELDRDQQEGRIADLELEILGLKQELSTERSQRG